MTFPPRFKPLTHITSPTTRACVSEELEKIYALIRQLKSGYVDPSINDLIDRYLAYLDHLCLTPQVINKKENWILQYSRSVRLKLASYIDLSSRKDTPFQDREDKDLLNKIESLVIALISMYSSHWMDPKDYQRLEEQISRLYTTASYVNPDNFNLSYLSIKEKIDDLIKEYILIVKCKLSPPVFHSVYCDLFALSTMIKVHHFPSTH